jgi:DNA invertase Pin-like site-specific DNA recombinase
MAAMAEHEGKAISARTQAALAAAKARGAKLGGYRWPIGTVAKMGNAKSVKVRKEKAAKRADDLRSLIREITKGDVTSLRQIAAALNARNITTPRKKVWTATQVQRVLSTPTNPQLPPC